MAKNFWHRLTYAFVGVAVLCFSGTPELHASPPKQGVLLSKLRKQPAVTFKKKLQATFWNSLCDLPESIREKGECEKESCRFLRSDGSPFEPHPLSWLSLPELFWLGMGGSLAPLAIQEGLLSDEALQKDSYAPLASFSGEAANLNVPPQGLSRLEMKTQLFRLNPKVLRFGMQNFVPEKTQAMCGGSAKSLYDAVLKEPLRHALKTLIALHRAKIFDGLSKEALAKSMDSKEGSPYELCTALISKEQDRRLANQTADNCWWFLRREAAKDLPLVKEGLQALFVNFDKESYQQLQALDAPFQKKGPLKKGAK